MIAAETSPSTGRRYGIAQVCRIWDVPRSSFYAARRRADTTTTTVPAQRHEPKTQGVRRRLAGGDPHRSRPPLRLAARQSG